MGQIEFGPASAACAEHGGPEGNRPQLGKGGIKAVSLEHLPPEVAQALAADFVAWEPSGFDEGDVAPAAGEKGGGDGARRSAADDENALRRAANCHCGSIKHRPTCVSGR